jgi:succinate dehydrogenase/fumarate reductase flavoprotein subunit
LAGVCAANSAAEAGANVILLDKTTIADAHSSLCAGNIAAAGSRLQAEAGYLETPEDYYQDLLEQGKSDPRLMPPELLKILTDNAGDTVDWLQDMGVPFLYVCWRPPDTTPRAHIVVDEQTCSPTGYTAVPAAAAQEKGVELLEGTRARELYRWADGSIAGVRAETENGESMTFMAKRGVVLTCGDDSNSPEMKQKFTRDVSITTGLSNGGQGNTGDGFTMAWAVGADSLCFDQISAPSGINPWPLRSGVGSFVVDAGAIIVNKDGKRFQNDLDKGGRIIDDQPDGVAFIVFDSVAAADETLVPEGAPLGRGCWIATARYLDHARLHPDIFKEADTIEELATKMGVSASGLVETVDKYNGYVAAGADPEFDRPDLGPGIKEPPFYSLGPGRPATSTMNGTLVVNTEHQVLDVFGNVIPRLYAAGDTGKSGNTVGHGTHMAWACVSGRRSGEFAAGETPVAV